MVKARRSTDVPILVLSEPVDDVVRHIAEQRAADRLHAEAVWTLRDAEYRAARYMIADQVSEASSDPTASFGDDDVVIELAVVSGHRAMVVSHPDLPTHRFATTVTASPVRPSGVLPG